VTSESQGHISVARPEVDPAAAAAGSPVDLWLRHVPWYAAAHLGPVAVGFAGLVILPRLLGPAGYGTYSVALAAATASAAWFGDWLVPAGMRLAPDAGRETREVWVALAGLSAVAAILAAAAAGALSAAFDPPTAVACAALALLGVTSRPLASRLRAELRTRAFAAWSLASSAAAFGAAVGAYIATGSVAAMIGAVAIPPLVASIWYWAGLVRGGIRYGSGLRWARAAISFGLPIAITGVGGQTLLLGDRYLLALLRSPAEAGRYVAAYAVAEKLVTFPFAILFAGMYPLGARAWARGDHDAALELLRTIGGLYSLWAGSVVVFLASSGSWLTGAVASKSFQPPGAVPLLVAGGTWLWYLGILQHQPLEWAKRTIVITALTLGAAGLNMALNVALIPGQGANGAAVATAAAYTAYLLGVTVVSRQGVAPRVWATVPVILAAMAVTLAYTLWGGRAGPAHGAVAAIGYLCVLWLARFWSPRDLLTALHSVCGGDTREATDALRFSVRTPRPLA